MIKRILASVSWIFPIAGSIGAKPAPQPGTVMNGQASFYAKSYIGKTMANGQPYNPRAFTLACNDLPLGTNVYITYKNRTGGLRFAHATVTDRGPAERLRQQGRIFDLSWALFNHLENPRLGVISIQVQVVD